VISNLDTALTLSNLTKVNDTKYTFLCTTKNHDFSTKNVKFTFTANRSVNGVPKKFVKSAKLVGVNQLGNMYRTQLWGLNSLGVTSLGNPQTASLINENYTPVMGDKICFDTDEMRGIITSMPVELSVTPAVREIKGKRFQFEVTQFNGKGKNERTVKKFKLYQIDFNQSTSKFLSTSKAEIATKYFR
jgi:hypothetical protein